MSVAFFIYAVVGAAIFYDLPQSEDIADPINRLTNWETYLNSAFFNLSLLTGEAWDLVQAKVMEEKPVEGIIYFLSYVFILSLLMLNLVVAVLYENLGLLVSFSFNGAEESNANINSFVKVWRKYDPDGTKFISEEDLGKFLTDLKPPMGVGDVSDSIVQEIIQELDIPVTRNGSVYFPHVLLALCERLYQIDSSKVVVASVMKGWKKAFPDKVETVKGRSRLPIWDTSVEADSPHVISTAL